MKKMGLNDLMNQNYYIILAKKKNMFYLNIPELSLIVEDKELNKAYEKLEKRKEEYFRNIIEMNAEETVELPSSLNVKSNKNVVAVFGPFLIKMSIILVVGFIFFNLAGSIARFVSYEIKSVPYEIINKLDSMSEKEIEGKRLLLKKVLKKLKPFVDDFKTVFEND